MFPAVGQVPCSHQRTEGGEERLRTLRPTQTSQGAPMTRRRMQAMLRGAGSIMDIYPDPDRYSRFVPAGTAEERLGETWRRVGKYIHDAAERVHRESESCTHVKEEATPARERESRPS